MFSPRTVVFSTLELKQGNWMQLTLGRRDTLHHAEEAPLICETHRQTSALANSRFAARLNKLLKLQAPKSLHTGIKW